MVDGEGRPMELNTGPTFSAGLFQVKYFMHVNHRSTTSMFVSKGHKANTSSGLIRLLADT